MASLLDAGLSLETQIELVTRKQRVMGGRCKTTALTSQAKQQETVSGVVNR